MKSILDPTFRYTPSHATDLRTTFKRIRDEQHLAAETAKAEAAAAQQARVRPLVRKAAP